MSPDWGVRGTSESCEWQKFTQSSLSKTRDSFRLIQECRSKCCGSPRSRIPNVTVETAVEALLPRLIFLVIGFLPRSSHAADLSGEPGLLFTHNSTCHKAGRAVCVLISSSVPRHRKSWSYEHPDNLWMTVESKFYWEEGKYPRKTKNLYFHAKQKQTKTSKQKHLSKGAAQAVTPAAPWGIVAGGLEVTPGKIVEWQRYFLGMVRYSQISKNLLCSVEGDSILIKMGDWSIRSRESRGRQSWLVISWAQERSGRQNRFHTGSGEWFIGTWCGRWNFKK